MLHVVLDTNIFHQEGLTSVNMQLLKRLAVSGRLHVYVPELVKREYLSKKSEQARESIAEAVKNILAADKKIGNRTAFHEHLQKAKYDLESMIAKVDEIVNADFADWENSTKAVLIPFDNQSIGQLFDGYFSGRGPFRKPKARDDIPDAVISACIEKIAAEQPCTYVVVKDGVLKRHLSSIATIRVTDDLTELFGVDNVKKSIIELDKQLANVDEMKTFFSSQEFQVALSKFLRRATEQFQNVYIEEDEVHAKHRLEIDSFGVSINYASAEHVQGLMYGEVIFLEDGHFSISVELQTTAEVFFCAGYDDYIHLVPPRSETVRETSMNGGRVYAIWKRRGRSRCLGPLRSSSTLHTEQQTSLANLMIFQAAAPNWLPSS
jgi:hypothetical protein